MVLLGKKRFKSGKVVGSDKSCFVMAKVVVFGKKWMYTCKEVVFGQGCCIRAKTLVFGQKWLYSEKSGCILKKRRCIQTKYLYSGRSS